MTIYTIGFTKKSARKFFELVCGSGATRLVDVRLHNVSQLAGFAKRDDLIYFLERICQVEYVAEPLLAPTAELLDQYRTMKIGWPRYEQEFRALMAQREIGQAIPPSLLENAVLLCSEDGPERCHRRLVAEYLARAWRDVEIRHLR
jgi:uncharacterized protein (DUF488 family)